MADFFAELPKAELHLHLEGSVEPETLHELDPSTPLEELRALYRYADFDAFLKAFGAVGKRLRTPEDYALITRRLLERLAAQNVRYAEIIVVGRRGAVEGAGVRARFSTPFSEAAAGSPVEVRWILDAVRQFGVGAGHAGGRTGGRAAWTAAWWPSASAAARTRGPAEWFGEVFAFARRAGLHLTAHAGEGTGAANRSGRRCELGAERIGHGIAAIEDPALMRAPARAATSRSKSASPATW